MSKSVVRYLFAAVLITVGLCALPASAGTINTFPTWDGSSTICCIGYPNTATYGEVFQSPGGTVTSLSFWMQQSVGFEFQAFIAGWDNNNYLIPGGLASAQLSPVQTVTNGGFVEYTVGGFNFATNPGDYYVVGVTIDNVYNNDAPYPAGTMGGTLFANGNSTYYFAWNNDSGNGQLLGQNWNNEGCADNSGACGQAAFLITIGSQPTTPEPSSFLLFGTGILGIAATLRRKLF